MSDILASDGGFSLLCVCRNKMLHIYGAVDTRKLRLYNTAGQEYPIRFTMAGEAGHIVCDLSSLAPGVYILDGGKETFKFIRQ